MTTIINFVASFRPIVAYSRRVRAATKRRRRNSSDDDDDIATPPPVDLSAARGADRVRPTERANGRKLMAPAD